MKLDRLLAITMMIVNRRHVSAKELSEYFEVSQRTIYRDIEAINLAGIPIISYRGNNGGFSIMEGYRLEKHLLDGSEVSSIITALKGLHSVVDDTKISIAIEKVKSLVPESSLSTSNSPVIIDLSRWDSNKREKDLLNTINISITNSHMLSFSYTNSKNETVERHVEPMRVVFKNMCWYLYGYCHLKNDYRLFKLARMRNLTELNKSFSPREISDQDYPWESDLFDLVDKNNFINITLKFSSSAKGMAEEYFNEKEIEYAEDGSVLVHLFYPEDEWVYGMIMSYGSSVEVLEPPHLRSAIAERARKIFELYQK